MKATLPSLVLVTLTEFAALNAPAADSPVDLPEVAIKLFLGEQGIPEIKSRPDAPLQRDFEARWLKWFQRVVIDAFGARLKTDAATKERAVKLAQKGIMQLRKAPQRDLAFTSDAMAGECEAVIKAGVDDPLIYWLQSWAIHDATRDFPASQSAFKKGWKHKTIKDMPAAQRELMIVSFMEIVTDARQSSDLKDRGKDVIEAAWQSLQDKTYLPDEDEVLFANLRAVFHEETFTKDEARVKEMTELTALSEWPRLMLAGFYLDRKAWLARGHGYAGEVKPEGWKGFEELRPLAVEALTRAWKLHPERPDPALHLVNIGVTGGDTGDDPAVWLERTFDARADYIYGCRVMENGLLPRWGGSHEKMIAFGCACALTKRFDTDLPYFFFEAMRDVARDTGKWPQILRIPVISETALALCRQRVRDAKTPELKEIALSLLGAYGWMCGDYKTAAEALARVPQGFRRPVIVDLLPYVGLTEGQVRGESVIFSAGLEELWASAEQASLDRRHDEAEKAYLKVLEQVKGAGADLAATRLTTVKIERELAQGEWTQLMVDPTLAGWRNQKGDWKGTPEGLLVNTGRGTSAFIYHLARVGTEFQIRGEFESNAGGLGVVVGFDTSAGGTRESWITCQQVGGADGSNVYVLHRYNPSSLEKVRIADGAAKASFLITCHAGKITYAVNDEVVFREVEPHDQLSPDVRLKLRPEGHVGFCHFLFDKGRETKILKAEVRLLPPDFIPDPPPLTPAAPDAESQKLLAGAAPWSGDIRLGQGFYKPEHKIEIGAPDPSDAKKIIPARVTSPPGVQFEGGGMLLKKDSQWRADGNLFKHSDVALELGARFEAKNSLFERCALHKGGGWFVKFFSSKWTFENCVFSRSFIKPWKLVDIGVKAANCTFYDVDFPPVNFREDAGKEALDEWAAVRNCRFVRCKIPESVLLATKDCVFEDCKFGEAEKKLPIKTPLKVRIYATDPAVRPAAGPDRTIEVADARTAPATAGATVKHRCKNGRLDFE